MRTTLSGFLVLVTVTLAGPGAARAFTWWNDIRASALLPDQTVTIRVENPPVAGATHTILYAEGGVQEVPLASVPDGPATLEARVPGPVSGPRGYGFRLVRPGALDVMAVPLAAGSSPAPADLTRLATDAVGDETTGRAHLDLTECRLGTDGTRLQAALTNVSGGFPVSSGLTFFSYLLAIKDPAVADPDTLFAMIHTVDVAGIIAPGLYRIEGTGVDDLVKIGEITATVLAAQNTLLLSCAVADLEADPVFQRWYDATDPRLDVVGLTQRITLLGGAQETDITPGGIWHLRQVRLQAGANRLPALTDLVVPAPGTGGFVSVLYEDEDGHCPVLAELLFPGGEVFPLRPQTLDYGQPVVYRSEPDLAPLESGGAGVATVRFSDNLDDVVTLARAVSAAPPPPAARWLQASPNPFNPATVLAFELAEPGPVTLAVYGIDGRLVANLAEGRHERGRHEVTWDGTDAYGRRVASGVWLARLTAADGTVTRKLTMNK
ncbi:MAG: T9SS type A sorting domain-containing protein [Krumholzibacteria bacterium]|nr:T9SS type A sorting domain-containing protein [Candidatus Krumholzibacteria bacterium]